MIKKFILVALLVGMLPALEGCIGCSHVQLGEVGIEVDNCGSGGVKLAGTGYHSTGPCTNIIVYPTNVQSAVWSHNPNEGHPINEEITFTNADQMQIAADISIGYHLSADKAPEFYKKFKADNIDTWTHGFLRNLAREKFDTAAGKYRIEQIMGDNANFLKEVKTTLQDDVRAYGITIDQFGFIGAPRPPQSVIDSINAKANAVQKSLQMELELKQSQAQAAKEVAEAQGQAQAIKIKADAEAYANQKLASSLSPVLVDYRRVEKWNGVMPQFSGNGANMLFQAK